MRLQGAERCHAWSPSEREVWRPPERLSISEWAEKRIVLTEPAEEKGPFRLRRTPYLSMIFSAVEDPRVETVVLCKSSQIGGTQGMIVLASYFVEQEPSPVMYVMADEDTAVYVSRERLQKTFLASERIASLVNDSRFNKDEMSFANGAYVCTGWASSVSRLAVRPIRILILDEVDKPGYSVKTKEGDSIYLAVQRTETFFNRKIVMLSTPTTEDGNVWSHLMSCGVIFDWHARCPYCGTYQPLRWSREECADFEKGQYRDGDGRMRRLGRVVWNGGRKASAEQIAAAGYECGNCRRVWTTLEKNLAVERGKPVPRTAPPEHPGLKVGIHVNRLYSLLGKSGDIPKLVRDWIDCLGDRRKEQGFINNVLAEPYMPQKSETRASQILALRDERPSGAVPSEGVIGLTCGVDTQDYGFYYVIRAWGVERSWLVRYGFVEFFVDVEEVLFEAEYADSEGRSYFIAAGLIDAMGHRTAEVYDWCRQFVQIRPSKGEQRMVSPFAATRLDNYPDGRPMPGGLLLYRINTNYFKDQLANKLKIHPADPGAFLLHAETGEDYVAQMTSEARNESGVWEQIRSRPNHYWDCEVLALAAAHIRGLPQLKGGAGPRGGRSASRSAAGPAARGGMRVARSKFVTSRY